MSREVPGRSIAFAPHSFLSFVILGVIASRCPQCVGVVVNIADFFQLVFGSFFFGVKGFDVKVIWIVEMQTANGLAITRLTYILMTFMYQ